MIGKVGQGGVPRMRPPEAGDSMANGASFENSGIEVGSSVKVGSRDDSASSTEPRFGDVWKKIQAQYGGQAEKPREVKKTLGKDDFLRLMVMQMKYQDPSKPFEMDKMGAEMAQLSSMEQLQNLNQTMKQLAGRDQPVERMAMTGMIGRVVTVDQGRFPHVEGRENLLKFDLPADAEKVVVTIADETGAALVQHELGAQKKGEAAFTWDGSKANTLPAKSGNYAFAVTAVDGSGREIKVSTSGSARVVGVSFEGQKPVLLVGDPANPGKVFMENVSRIVDDGASAASAIPGARPLSSAVASSAGAAAPSGGRFFSFTQGEGSKPMDAAALSGEDARAIQAFQAQAADTGQGFPNGLESEE